ncbi:Site-specific recombinase XerD [Chitinophaga terrae (ex Kim and Jung 2007)]|uniref:Site-specific recombinase XerD n=1 Tax=Chitinophaga terrae (ex Kim and Jung 2007) TaxID=408074 RepID=A0A1H4GIN7_9BACT|nr:site-specific integrase [Chitinophaga terrae (ex Kim and Jung 2007)]GEP93498.1 transposase [Chitinophaga terrae (ex Kim and Jung 2007)]SEB09493.1 Site-specific recombinase XerD [Chitinophaga terrae (ex Kim and Jung 2007)]
MMKGHLSFSILLWLNRSRCKNNKPAIYLRLTVGNKRAELSTYQYVSPELWNAEGQCVKGNSEEVKAINRRLITLKSELQKHYSLLVTSGKPATAQALKNSFLGIVEHKRTLCEAIDFHNKRFGEKVKAKTKSARTLKRFEITKDKIVTFLKNYFHVSDMPLGEIKFSFAPDFEHYLTTTEKLGSNTAMKYVKILKQMLKLAVDQGWLSANPLGGFKCSYVDPQRERLTMDEIMTLYNKELIPRLAEVRDIYLFCCFTGYAYTDVLYLTTDNIITGIDGEKWIVKERAKTLTPERVPLLPIALEIIERYKNSPYCQLYGRLLPVNSNQRYNAYLKEIAGICDIKKYLTTHTARHTFATTVTLENDVPIETVSQLLGHKSIRTTQIYAKITQQKVSNNMRLLRKRLFGEGVALQKRSV